MLTRHLLKTPGEAGLARGLWRLSGFGTQENSKTSADYLSIVVKRRSHRISAVLPRIPLSGIECDLGPSDGRRLDQVRTRV